ncbi:MULTISPECIES: EamA family transporter [unclassified Moorena]|uniref:EamA family transporter n=1 Tax=unclassified Moorena TaxID=2683338 RepID=UPI001400D27F|nr:MULTISPECIES: EamA family transporter [unclassified Moorena]NEO12247.1 EamA family transporter [Moorena sp. SIO3E8]NEQ02979.1 EamA family transporter [Moorena sp. SIO3F7]
MLWLIFASLTALFASGKDLTSKRGLKNVDAYIVSWALFFFYLPVLLPLLFVIEIPELGRYFGLALMVGGSLNVLAMSLYIQALSRSDLSITVPFVTFTPLFLLVTSPIIVGEYPTPLDMVGIMMIVLGSYSLNLKEKRNGYLAPFKGLLKQRGPKLMLTAAVIFSITSNVDKVGVQNSSPIFWAIALHTFIATGMGVIMLYKSRSKLNQIPKYLLSIVPIGLFQAGVILCQMTALEMTFVSHVIAVKRMSVLISVILGCLIFKEPGIQERATGAAIMVLGVVLISLSGH